MTLCDITYCNEGSMGDSGRHRCVCVCCEGGVGGVTMHMLSLGIDSLWKSFKLYCGGLLIIINLNKAPLLCLLFLYENLNRLCLTNKNI